ncbi:hypothetical protein LTR62_001376 [Meristemomyces frigidus]|uniref:CN hydrolase domain-containing protein n=1 Tax=Meristemomyces frigidus TaxID=1508187 RepID=A0AAN7YBM1_9PEZI|nr:hypothetical protein LTR62_001376 [Meristemomyces frigidus]
MRIATLQIAPSLGQREQNITKANTLTSSLQPGQVDLLVLPELAFSGYNFPNLSAIQPFLEPTTSGQTTQWAIVNAKRLHCHIIVGYPEIYTNDDGQTTNFNSNVTVSPEGKVLNNYRKSFLYYTDETWASEGFMSTTSKAPFFAGLLGDLGAVGQGICMDINPYRFEAPWSAYEFANRMLEANVKMVVLSMAWLTRMLPADLLVDPNAPDMETVAYWVERFRPFVESSAGREIVVVFANRCGTEGNTAGSVEVENGQQVEEGDRVCYAGSSCVMKFEHGQAKIFQRRSGHEPAVLGKGEEGLLIVDTKQPAQYVLQQRLAG